jgi:HAD superfamily hydrolase (TIGR01509 family)
MFDLDGVLVDSLPLHHRAYQDVLDARGVRLSYERFLASATGPAVVTIPLLVGAQLSAEEIRDIHEAKIARFEELIEAGALPVLPSLALLSRLSGVVPTALVTSASGRTLELVDRTTDVVGLVDRVVSGDDVARGKPDPEPYLLAAASLAVEPSRCIAFEDSSGGIESARRAGLRVVPVAAPVP